MDNSQFSTFKYQHSDAVHRSALRKVVAMAFLALSGWSFFYASSHISDGFIPVAIVTLLIGLGVYGAVPRNVMIGPRYLLCGQTIIYYANVVRIILYRNGGAMELHTAKGKIFILERDKFPTGARREPKITKNKTDKFNKVSAKIIEKVQQVRPNVEKIGC
jgi:hypothetical protein